MSAALRIRAAIILPVALLLGIVPGAGAARQDGGPLTRVDAISPFVDADRPLRIVVRVVNATPEPVSDVSMRVSVHPRVFTRSQLRSAIDDGPATGSITTLTQTLADPIPPGRRALITLERAIGDVGAFSQTGVYPIRIVVRAGEQETVSTTAIPALRAVPESRLNVAWMLRVDRPIAFRGDGTYDPSLTETLQPGLLTQQMRVLTARPGLPVTLIPSGDLIDMLADLRDGTTLQTPAGPTEPAGDSELAFGAGQALIALREAARVVGEVASTTYTDTDLSALALHGLRSDVLRQLSASRRAVEEHLGRTPTFRFLVPDRGIIGRAEAETLATLGVENLLLDPEQLPEEPRTPTDFPGLRYELFGTSRPIVVRSGPHRFGGLVLEPDLRARLDGEGASTLLAQALIAETAASWLEVPSLAPERTLVIGGTDLPRPEVLATALDGMASAPWIRMRTASDTLGSLPPDGDAVTLPDRRPPDQPYLAEARQARRSLGILESLTAEEHPRSGELDRMTLLAESATWEQDPSIGVALARVATDVTNSIVENVRVAEGRVVTLTSRTGALPVTVINRGTLPVRIRVRLESAKAIFPDGDSQTIDLTDQATLDFGVEARAAGAFPVNVFVETTDGRVRLARGSIVMRSTAVSAVALAAIGGGIIALIAASIRRRRRIERAAD